MNWVLLWIYLAPSGQLDTEIEHVAAKSVVMLSRETCERERLRRLDVNDTRYMIDYGHARLLCVEIPARQ